MGRKSNPGIQAINILHLLVQKYPNQSLSQHLAIAFGEYNNVDNLTDKEFHFALKKYKEEKDLDMQIPHSEDINRIIEEGSNIDNLLKGILEDDDDF